MAQNKHTFFDLYLILGKFVENTQDFKSAGAVFSVIVYTANVEFFSKLWCNGQFKTFRVINFLQKEFIASYFSTSMRNFT